MAKLMNRYIGLPVTIRLKIIAQKKLWRGIPLLGNINMTKLSWYRKRYTRLIFGVEVVEDKLDAFPPTYQNWW
jgi:hypothetical protein